MKPLKIWTFGDSFTESFNEEHEWCKNYIKWKGYKPEVYGEILSRKLDLKLINKGMGGLDNDTIMDKICESIEDIRDNDIIIIGWSSVSRFRLSTINKTWEIFLPNSKKLDLKLNNFKNLISRETIDEILINRDSLLYINELNLRIKLLNRTFQKNKIIHWSPFTNTKINGLLLNELNNITTETNQECINAHYSETGHIELSRIFLEIINSENKVKLL
jgi:hypothetical protein